MTKIFNTERLYLKNLNYTSRKTPEIFSSDVETVDELNLNVEKNKMGDDKYEVTLNLMSRKKLKESTDNNEFIYSFHIQYSGIFQISGFDDDEIEEILVVHCGSTLLPFAREKMTAIISESGFKAFVMQPFDFKKLLESK